MLSRMIIIFFVVDFQLLAGEKFMPSPDVMAHAMQQAQQIQNKSEKLIKDKSINNVFKRHNTHKGCPSQNLKEGKKANKGCINNITTPLSEKDKSSQILVFVSFSMPEASLKSLFQEAQNHNAVLITRGLYKDSFVQTAQKLQELGVTIDINPELFDLHNIASVPTFIFLTHSHPTHLLRGNVTLEFVSQKFKEQQSKESHSKELRIKEAVS